MNKYSNLPAALRSNYYVISTLVNEERVAFAAAAANKIADRSKDEAAWSAAFDKAAAEWWNTGLEYQAAIRAATDFTYLGAEAIKKARRLMARRKAA